jgi:GntR family transcriptional regulator, arabinose operon transcriptional repressor
VTIDTESRIPKYHQLKEIILRTIREGAIGEGQPLPSEHELVRRFHVSRNTVRQAIDELERDGMVERRQGKGTYYRSKAGPRTRLLGVITPFVSQYIYPDIIRGIEERAHSRCFSMVLGHSNGDPDKERSLVETMLANGIEGLLIEPARSARVCPETWIHRRLKAAPVPVVLMDCIVDGLSSSTVTPADVDGGRIATEYLAGKGHRRIAMVYKTETVPGVQRHAGYLAALATAGLEVRSELAVTTCEGSGRDLGPIRDAVRGLLALGDRRPTAIIFYNDEWAAQGLQVLLDAGVSVPGDVSIVGFDDTDLCNHARVPITSLTHPKGELGRQAVDILLDEIDGRDGGSHKRIVIIPRVVERDTVAPPPT